MELNGAKILYTIHTNIPVLGDFKITQTLVSTWIVMALLSGLAFWLGRNLKLENVSKRQAAAEFIVERLDQFVHDNMGLHFDQYIPLVGAIFALSIGCNLISVVGLWSPTADLNTEAAWAIVVFVLIMYYKIKTNGILAYLKGLLDPIFLMAPINVLSEISTPVSMAFRHFGNILSGTVISTLLYWALASLSHVIFGWLPGVLSQLQLFQIGIPAFTGLYFRLVRRLHPGVHLLHSDHHLHQTRRWRGLNSPRHPLKNKNIIFRRTLIMTDFQFLARGIALAGCGIGAGLRADRRYRPWYRRRQRCRCGLRGRWPPARVQERRYQHPDPGRRTVGDHRYLRLRHRPAAHLPGSRYVHELPAVSAPLTCNTERKGRRLCNFIRH